MRPVPLEHIVVWEVPTSACFDYDGSHWERPWWFKAEF